MNSQTKLTVFLFGTKKTFNSATSTKIVVTDLKTGYTNKVDYHHPDAGGCSESYLEKKLDVTLLKECKAIAIPSGELITIKKGIPGKITQAIGNSYTLDIDNKLLKIAKEDARAIGLTVKTKRDVVGTCIFQDFKNESALETKKIPAHSLVKIIDIQDQIYTIDVAGEKIRLSKDGADALHLNDRNFDVVTLYSSENCSQFWSKFESKFPFSRNCFSGYCCCGKNCAKATEFGLREFFPEYPSTCGDAQTGCLQLICIPFSLISCGMFKAIPSPPCTLSPTMAFKLAKEIAKNHSLPQLESQPENNQTHNKEEKEMLDVSPQVRFHI